MDKDLIIQLQQEQLCVQARLLIEQRTMNDQQKTMIQLLEAHVETLENNQKKDSSNSGKPPSSDVGKVRRTQRLRTRERQKAGWPARP